MYSHGNGNTVKELRELFKKLIVEVPLHEMQKVSVMELYYWRDITEKLLTEHDEEFVLSLTEHLISGCSYGYEHGDIWSDIKPVLSHLMSKYGNIVWPKFAHAVVTAGRNELYWLHQLLGRETGLANNTPSVLSMIPTEDIISWCMQNNPSGAIFVSRCLNIFDFDGHIRKPSELFVAIIDNFGQNESVTNELYSNFASRGWSGSLVPYLEEDKKALAQLLNHESESVSSWVNEFIQHIDVSVMRESQVDEELNFRAY